jgi:hypothetical protein
MSDLVFCINLNYQVMDLSEPETRERVEQALNIACSALAKHDDAVYVNYKIREILDLE